MPLGVPFRAGVALRASQPASAHSLAPGFGIVKRRAQRAVGKTAFERDVEVRKGLGIRWVKAYNECAESIGLDSAARTPPHPARAMSMFAHGC